MAKLTLILGGASSGKSLFAENLARATKKQPVYLATAQALDGEMEKKISRHRMRRGPEWALLEAPVSLAPLFCRFSSRQVVLLDCLTLWLSNLMHAARDIDDATDTLLCAIRDGDAETVAVSNETGLGLVPETQLGRRFRDAQGLLNQKFAAAADEVTFVAAGLPLCLKAPA